MDVRFRKSEEKCLHTPRTPAQPRLRVQAHSYAHAGPAWSDGNCNDPARPGVFWTFHGHGNDSLCWVCATSCGGYHSLKPNPFCRSTRLLRPHLRTPDLREATVTGMFRPDLLRPSRSTRLLGTHADQSDGSVLLLATGTVPVNTHFLAAKGVRVAGLSLKKNFSTSRGFFLVRILPGKFTPLPSRVGSTESFP